MHKHTRLYVHMCLSLILFCKLITCLLDFVFVFVLDNKNLFLLTSLNFGDTSPSMFVFFKILVNNKVTFCLTSIWFCLLLCVVLNSLCAFFRLLAVFSDPENSAGIVVWFYIVAITTNFLFQLTFTYKLVQIYATKTSILYFAFNASLSLSKAFIMFLTMSDLFCNGGREILPIVTNASYFTLYTVIYIVCESRIFQWFYAVQAPIMRISHLHEKHMCFM